MLFRLDFTKGLYIPPSPPPFAKVSFPFVLLVKVVLSVKVYMEVWMAFYCSSLNTCPSKKKIISEYRLCIYMVF